MFLSIIIIAVVVQGLVALFVLQKNNKDLTNVLFFLLSVSLITWAVINFIITNNPYSSNQLLLYRLLMTSVVVQNTFFYFFSHTYPNHKIDIKSAYNRAYFVLSAVAVTATLSPIVFTNVSYGSGGARPIAGPGMLIFIAHAGISVIIGLKLIFKRYKKAKGAIKRQFGLIFMGSLILWGVVPITNFAISMATQTLIFAKLSPIYTLAFSSVIAYAIVTQKLFDIKLVVARSVAYIFSIGVLAVSYISVSTLIVNTALSDFYHDSVTILVNMAGFLVAVVLFPTLKHFFDKLSNKIFFRDSYDPQEFLDELNKILVSMIELEPLLERTIEMIEERLKSEFAVFFIARTTYFPPRLIGDEKYNTKQLENLLENIPVGQRELIVTDFIEEDEKLRRQLNQEDVAIVIALSSGSERVGNLVLGPKKSGDLYTRQDIRLLQIVANELVIAVQNSLRFEEIEKFNIKLQREIDDATRMLKDRNKRLVALDETKDDFISMASHQLRTPLTSVKGYLSMTLEGDGGQINEKQRKLLTQAFISSERMVYLISDMLNLSRLKTGKFVIDPVPINLAELISTEIEQLKGTLKSRGLTLSFKKPNKFPILALDETKIRQVIMNFIDNAIYYTPNGGEIEVKLVERDKSIEFTVSDTGIGVPKAERHHLFTKFYRAKNAKKARPDGTGLGLFMAKKVIIAQGGGIIFHSIEGKGSTFGFTFNKKKLMPEEDSKS